MDVENGFLSKTLKVDSYWYNEDKSGWYDEFEYDGYDHIIFNFIWMIWISDVYSK